MYHAGMEPSNSRTLPGWLGRFAVLAGGQYNSCSANRFIFP